CCLLCLNSSFLLILVFFMIRLPPSSTLFPYTTLFRSLFFRDRQIVPIAPLFPRAQVVAQLVVSDQVQGEEIDRSTHADLAIRDDLLRRQDAAVFINPAQLVGWLERFALRIEQILPIHRHRRGHESAPSNVSQIL